MSGGVCAARAPRKDAKTRTCRSNASQAARVVGRPGGELRRGPRVVRPERDGAPVLGREDPDRRRDEREPVAPEVELPDEGGAEPPDCLEGSRGTPPVGEGPRLDLAADRRPALQDDRPEPRLREEGARREAVVAAADDDGVEAVHCLRPAHAWALPFFALRSSRAARRPFAPMIPPPGWVEEPHIQ